MSEANDTINNTGIILKLGALPPGTILDRKALARIFGRCTTTVIRAVARGELPPSIRMFGKASWTAGVILNHLEKRLEKAQREADSEAKRIARMSP